MEKVCFERSLGNQALHVQYKGYPHRNPRPKNMRFKNITIMLCKQKSFTVLKCFDFVNITIQ